MRTIRTTTISILTVGLLAGSAVGVAAQAEYFAWTYGDREVESVEGTYTETSDWMTIRDSLQVDFIEADDERASGPLSIAFNLNAWVTPNGDAPEIVEVTTYSQRLVNDDGSWSGTGTAVVSALDGVDPNGAGMVTLTGEGGYEGLTLILLTMPGDEEGGTGFILPSVPPVPELPAE